MAKIKLDLTQFKASGVYTLEFDASESIILNTQTVRLVVGFSRKGPFNSPVYLPDVKTARRIFGEIDPFLESRGSFFHRSIFTCLEIGPVFGLNLLPLNNQPITQGGDAVEYRSFSVDTAESNGPVTRALYSNFYNTQRFWFPDESNMIAIANANALNTGKLLHVVNLSQGPLSVIIKKTAVNGFDITARDWYGQSGEERPAYVRENDYIADYFVEAIIVQGNWTNYKKLSTDPVFSKYFNERGILKTQLNAFLATEEITTVARFTGCLIPDFVDGNGVTHSLDTVVNNSVATTGVFLAFNKESLADYETSTSKFDVVGHNLADPNQTIDFLDMLSYKTNLKEEFEYTEKTGSFDTTVYVSETTGDIYTESYRGKAALGAFKNVIVIKRPLASSTVKYAQYQQLVSDLNVGGSLIEMDSGNWAKVESKQETFNEIGETVLKVTYSHPGKSAELTMSPVNVLGASFTTTQSVTLNNGDDFFETTNVNQLRVNQPLSGLGIPADTYITNIDTSVVPHVVTMSAASDIVGSATVTVTFLASVTVSGDQTANIIDGDEVLIKNKIDTTTFYVNVNADPILNTSSNTILPVSNIISLQDMSVNPNYYTSTFGALEFPDLSSDQLTFVYTPDLFLFNSSGSVNKFVCYQYSDVYKDFDNGFLLNGDQYYYNDQDFFYLKYEKSTDSDGVSVLEIRAYADASLSTVITDTSTNTFLDTDNHQKGNVSANTGGVINIYPFADSFSETFVIQSWNNTKTEVDVNVADATGLEVGQYLVSYTTDEQGGDIYRLTKIIRKRKIFDELTSTFRFRYTVNQAVLINNEFSSSDKSVTRYKNIDEFVSTYEFTGLSGFKLTSYHLPGDKTNKQSQMEKIYEVLENTNLFETLTSRDVIQFRYIIDTFDGGLQPNNYPKNILAKLAKERLKCLAILNPPSAKQFEASTDPRFTDEPDPVGGNPRPLLNTAYIASGGNQTLGPSFSYSLPDELNGAKHAAFFFPYLVLRDGTKNITVPPAAHVSNNFVLKFINGFPYSIVAGPRRGILSDSRLIGPEIDLSDGDRESIEPFGLNPIVKRARVGTMIYGNQTAYQKVPSALNSVHVRDLLITIEEGVEDILARYIFEFNDATTRLEIKSIVDTFLDGVRSAGGIYNFFTQMDETNNTPEIIDQNKAIIDIAVEPARGIQVAISRITVTKTGGANASAFQFV